MITRPGPYEQTCMTDMTDTATRAWSSCVDASGQIICKKESHDNIRVNKDMPPIKFHRIKYTGYAENGRPIAGRAVILESEKTLTCRHPMRLYFETEFRIIHVHTSRQVYSKHPWYP